MIRCQRFCFRNIRDFQRTLCMPLLRQAYPALAVRYSTSERSKVEETLQMLKEDLKRQQEEDARRDKMLLSTKADAKPPLKTRIVNELKHYYHGFRLLALETKLSARYIWRLAHGASLTRRERQQLVRTVSDLFRLVPFSIFIIVPFMELALPIFIKLFPNMLPSTFQEASKEEEKLRKQVLVRVEMAKFLQSTIEEIALQRKSNKQESRESKAVEFAEFMKKLRTEGGYASNEDLFKYSPLFEDELTLDNLSMSQLRALCRVLLIQPLGTPEILRFQLNFKLRELKADDKQIMAEGGVDNLTSVDLQNAVRARGMRALGVSEERLREQLTQWLELSLNDKVPPSLLLLSRILYLPEDLTFAERLRAIVSKLPDGIGEQTRQKLTELEGGTVDHKARLDLILGIEKGIADEKIAEQKAVDEKKKRKLAEESSRWIRLEEEIADVERQFGVIVETVKKSVEEETPKTSDPAAHMPVTIDQNVLASIEDILCGNAIKEAKHDITELKEKVIEHTEDLIEVGSLAEDYAETKGAKRLRNRVNVMISGIDTLVAKLEAQKKEMEAQEELDKEKKKLIEEMEDEEKTKV
ncbi:hypothetical protein L596_007569 [Steinernema carpocapsae]|nr:hypothetical protein L596_007569 [Steinernema carpocapsae]